jgi:mRNA-degrading endonuclease YafQ of YafQ-DinJ toxin-antitoxin module
VRRRLLRSSAFIRAARRVVKRSPQLGQDLITALEALEQDAFHPSLRSHKLKGRLEGSWACSAGYDLRILFRFVHYEDSEAILLLTVGGHEEVY